MISYWDILSDDIKYKIYMINIFKDIHKVRNYPFIGNTQLNAVMIWYIKETCFCGNTDLYNKCVPLTYENNNCIKYNYKHNKRLRKLIKI